MAYTLHAGEGCAGRFATGRGVDRSLRSLPNRPGLRVPATPSVRGLTWTRVRWVTWVRWAGREGLAGERAGGQATQDQAGGQEGEGGQDEEEEVGGAEAEAGAGAHWSTFHDLRCW